uniref:Jupiter microtubule associated homolog 1 n=1 Tax=Panagrellus redivivus TaxID=6233 RepID=A0A7E4V8N4_PANRE
MNMMSVVCCTPPTTPGHVQSSSQFFDSMNGLKEENDLRKSFYDHNMENEDASRTKMMKSSTPDESPFGIVDINPGQLPRYLGDKGKVNQAFSWDTPVGTLNRKSFTSHSNASGERNHVRYPPTPATSTVFPTEPGPDAIVLDKPPVRRNSNKAHPPASSNVDMAKKAPPPPPKLNTEPSSSSPPKPITDHLLDIDPTKIPLPPRKRLPSETYVKGDSLHDDKTPATCPPRPPKPSTSQRNSPVSEVTHPKTNDPDAPPLPPKTYRKTFSLNA